VPVQTGSRKKRPYNSARRRAQAEQTRRQIVEAARRLFADRGYVGTTVEAIAGQAQVAPETVYAAFGSKRAVLSRLIALSVLGDEGPGSLMDRPGPMDVQREADPRRKVALFARDIRQIMERVSPLFEIMRAAARTEPEIAALLERTLAQRMRGMRHFVQLLVGEGALRAGLSSEVAAETVFTITSPEVFRLLTVDLRWPAARYEDWLSETLTRLLLA
jgi:AcrR family transcriptional regulator